MIPNPGMPLLLVVEMRPNLAALELVTLIEAVDSLYIWVSMDGLMAGERGLTLSALMTDSNLI